MPQERYRTRRGRDLGPQQRISLPGAAKADRQKRFGQPWRYSSWELDPSWDPWRSHAESIGRPWRAPRTLAEAIQGIETSIGTYPPNIFRRYLGATLIVELYDMLVLLVWPDWEFDWEPHFRPEDARQAIHDVLAAWAMHAASEEPSRRGGGFPPWVYSPGPPDEPPDSLPFELIRTLQPDLTDSESAEILRTLLDRFGGVGANHLYYSVPVEDLRYLNQQHPNMPHQLEGVLYRWWEEIALPLLMAVERNPYVRIPNPDTAESPFFMGKPWWLVVMDETSTFEGRELLAASGGGLYSVWLWNPLNIQYYASPYNPFTTLYPLDLVPKQSPDEEEARERLHDQLIEEVSNLTLPREFWADFNYAQIERFPHLTGMELPDQEADPEKRVGAIYNDYFDVTENIDDAMEGYHQNPRF